MYEYGYNLFNESDSFYNDICTLYESLDGTDILLSDRQEIYYNNSKYNYCQKDCSLLSYNKDTKKENCNCKVQNDENIKTDLKNIEENEKENQIVDHFFTTLTNSNFLVMQCYKLVFSEKGIINNIGGIYMIVSFCILLTLFLIYAIHSKNNIKVLIYEILDNRIKNKKDNGNNKLNRNKTKRNSLVLKNIFKHSKNKQNDIQKRESKENNTLEKKCGTFCEGNNNSKEVMSLMQKRKVKAPPKKLAKKKLPPLNENKLNRKLSKEDKRNPLNILIQINNNNNYNGNQPSTSLSSSISKNQLIKEHVNNRPFNKFIKNIKKKISKELGNNKNLNAQELNALEYDSALDIDKRTFLQMYYDLIKRKQLIFFAFVPNNDYNLIVLKISLFILNFSTLLVINGFFISDDTMHKIYNLKGDIDFFFEVTKTLYSTFISMFLNTILRYLSLTEENILLIKQQKTLKSTLEQSTKSKKCIYIKIRVFYIITFILVIFYWYFVSCFCAVYNNTQFVLIKNCIISFIVSLIYPFFLYLIPSFLRHISLKAHKKDREEIYKISKILSII